jgi:hypothetical protein
MPILQLFVPLRAPPTPTLSCPGNGQSSSENTSRPGRDQRARRMRSVMTLRRPPLHANYKTDYKNNGLLPLLHGAHDQANRYIGAANRVYADMLFLHVSSTHSATSRTRLTSLTWEPARSSSTGIKSRSSLSWASENQLLIGTACCGWKMYEVGELSMMMVSFRSRPICDKSYTN